MKQLNLEKPHLFILAGIPGAGKTYFADHFSKTYSLPVISNTHTSQLLFDKPDFSDDEQAIVRRINIAELEQLLKTKCNIIYDGFSDTRVSRYEISKLATHAGYIPLVIWLQTDLASANRRAISSSMSHEQFERYVRKFTAPNDKEKHIVISGKHLASNQTRNIINKLNKI